MQYHYQATKTKSQTLKRKSLELQERVGEVSQEDFADMRAAMNPQSVQIMIGSCASKQSKGDSGPKLHKADGDVDVEVNWAQVYKDNQKKCKSSLCSMATELHNCDTLLGKIAALSDKSEMKPLLRKQVLAQKVLMEEEKSFACLTGCMLLTRHLLAKFWWSWLSSSQGGLSRIGLLAYRKKSSSWTRNSMWNSLTPGVLNKDQKKTNKTATLKGLAAQIRHLIPLLPIFIAIYFSGGNGHQQATN